MEYKLFDGDIPYVSTREFHADRERAPHLEQPGHRERLLLAAEFILGIYSPDVTRQQKTLSDLGCGDGGLLSLVQDRFAGAWGYDFCPANAEGWNERRVSAALADVFGRKVTLSGIRITLGNIVVMTEVLEHLADPRAALRWALEEGAEYLVCSSPFTETDKNHCAEHAWAWDIPGYKDLLGTCGWNTIEHRTTGMFQVVLAERTT